MGCCSSTARINIPSRFAEANLNIKVPDFHGTYEEEEKDPEKVTKSSPTDQNTEPTARTLGTAGQTNGSHEEKPQQEEKEVKEENDNEQKLDVSRFDLYKEYERSVVGLEQIERDFDFANPEKSQVEWLQTDESRIKISQNQHRVIQQFVEERRMAIQRGIACLYETLSKNLKEHEKVPFYIEELKNNIKDIENCLEDLVSYPFLNDREYLFNLHTKRELIQKITFEYNTFQKNLHHYKDFRTVTLGLLLQHDSILPNARLYPYRYALNREENNLVNGKEQEKSLLFIPKDSEPNSVILNESIMNHNKEFDFDLGIVTGSEFLSEELKLKENNKKKSNSSQRSKQYSSPPNNKDLVVLYYKLIEDFGRLNHDLHNYKGSFGIIKAEVQDYKGQRNMNQIPLQSIKEMEQSLYQENQDLKTQYQKLEEEVRELIKQNKKEFSGTDTENEKKWKDLEWQIKKKIAELNELKSTIPLIFENLNEETEKVLSLSEIKRQYQVSDQPLFNEGRQYQAEKNGSNHKEQLNQSEGQYEFLDSAKINNPQKNSLKSSLCVVKANTNERTAIELELPLNDSNEKSLNKGQNDYFPMNRANSNGSTADSNEQDKKMPSKDIIGKEVNISRNEMLRNKMKLYVQP